MRIGILTQPLGLNYGGIVQNFALQKVLTKAGYAPYTYNRTWGKSKITLRDILYFIKNNTIDHLRGKHRYMLSEPEREYISKNSYEFMKKHMSVSPILYDFEQFEKEYKKHKAEALIVGSDQVWRPMYSPQLGNYFFDFVSDNESIIKLSYAASFGTSKWEYSADQTQMAKDLIKNFDGVSVREKTGVELCEKYLDVEAEWVVDPTLLVDKEDYIDITKGYNENRKGIFTYVLDKSKEVSSVIDTISNKLNLPIFKNQPKFAQSQNSSKNLEDYVLPPVESWISAFNEADYVVTDSFHGTVFSIIFNKPFFVVVNKGRGSARFESLLSDLGLENRIVSSINIDEKLFQPNSINFNKVNEILESKKFKGLDFLINNLNKNKH